MNPIQSGRLFILSIIFILILPLTCLSQKNFKKGYIITKDYDTVRGYINLQSNFQNSKFCEFRAEPGSVTETFSPDAITGYRFDNSKFYLSRVIHINNEYRNVYLEYLLKGVVNLFYYTDILYDYYYIEKDGTLFELSDNNIQLNVNSTTYQKHSNEYYGILKMVFRDSPETLKKIPNTSFGYKSLISITKDYHNNVCKDKQCVEFARSTKIKTSIEPFLGYRFSRLCLRGSKDKISDSHFNPGINFRFIPYRIYSAWSFKTGFAYYSSSFSGNFKIDKEDYIVNIQTKYNALQIPVTLEYTFPGIKVQPCLSMSYYSVFITNSEFKTTDNYSYGSFPYSAKYKIYQFAFAADAGLKYNPDKKKYLFIRDEIEYDLRRIFSNTMILGLGFYLNFPSDRE